MPAAPAADPVRDRVRRLANDHAADYTVQGDTTWWHFDPIADRRFRRQGWKLHVSAAPVTALDTLSRVAQVVLPKGSRWKVARSVGALMDLCSPPSPISQVGKFITVYADDDSAGVDDLAAELHEVTRDFDAPVVPSDRRYCRGSNIYLRYGAFSSHSTYSGPDQTRKWTLVDADGRQVEDRRAPGQYAPAWVAEPELPVATPRARGGAGLFGRGIAVTEVLRQSPKGGVYRVRYAGEPAVMKEARIGTCPDLLGRDSRSALLNEWELLQLLRDTGLSPRPIAFFFEEDNAYLVEEFLPGRTLRSIVERMNYRDTGDSATRAALSRGVRSLVRAVRSHGVIPYDLTPNNVIVDGGRFSIIDLEHAGAEGTPEPRFRAWTPGYSPRDALGRSIESFDLEFTLAAIDHFVLTGADPYIAPSVPYAAHVPAVLDAFVPDAAEVPGELAEVRSRLACPVPALEAAPEADRVLDDALAAGRELVRRAEWDRRPWPWPEHWSPGSVHPLSFMAGTAGIVQYYLDLARASGDPEWSRHAEDLLVWSTDTIPFVGGQTPTGLYFGVGALPWLMVELTDARDPEEWRRRALGLTAEIERAGSHGWDITHGWAGIGLAQLAVLRATGDAQCRAAARRTLRRVLDAASTGPGVPGWDKDGQTFLGFAHGSAGIAHFLLTAGHDLGEPEAVDLALATGRALLAEGIAVADGRGVSWPHRAGADTIWTHWCNGAAGVGAFLAALATATGDPEIADGAVRAGRAITATRPFGSCCRCHGLAGDGDFLLDLAALPGAREEFHAGARLAGRKLDALAFDDGAGPKWAHEGNGEPRPSFMRGYTGIHSFRLRLAGLLDRTPLMLPINAEETST